MMTMWNILGNTHMSDWKGLSFQFVIVTKSVDPQQSGWALTKNFGWGSSGLGPLTEVQPIYY